MRITLIYSLQAADQYKQRLRGSLALMGEKRTKLASSRDEIDQKLKNCKEQKETLQQDILKQTDILVKGIRQVGFHLWNSIIH